MKTRATPLVLLAAACCSLPANSRAGLQPATDSLVDTTTVVDSSGATMDFIASGGECPSPDAARNEQNRQAPTGDDWQKDGDVVYVWSYDNGPEGLLGAPTPNVFPGADAEDHQDTLRLNKDEGGQVSVIVYAVQKWKTLDGRVAVTYSSAS